MRTIRPLYFALAVAGCAALVAAALPSSDRITAAEHDIAGVVTGPNGPEAGVWVIAETAELPTTLVKIVVTASRGRYVIPELPTASYSVWVRGYGLVDSPKLRAAPGTTLKQTAVIAADAHAAAD